MKRQRKRIGFVQISMFLFFVIVIGSWVYLIVKNDDLFAVFNERNLGFLENFIQKMFGKGAKEIAYTNKSRWMEVLKLTVDTVAMSLLANGLAMIGTLITVVPAAANYADGRLTGRKSWYGKLIFVIIRFVYIITRSVPELVWGMLFVFFIQAGVLPGALALAVHNFGVLGRMCAEVVEDIDMKPLQSLARCGASGSQLLLYGVFPMCFKKFLYYMMFRFEVIIRATIVVGAVGAGGLGLYFKLRMSAMDYTGVTLVIMCYLLVVYITDIVSERLQKMWSA